MKDKLLISLAHAVKGYLTEPNSTKIIQKVLRAIHQQLNASCVYIALKNETSLGVAIKYSLGLPMQSAHRFQKKLGSNTIGRIFFKGRFTVINKETSQDDYAELKIDKDYAECVACHIAYGGHTRGFLACYFDEPKSLDISDKTFISSGAAVCAAALEKSELLADISELRQFDAESGIYSHQYFVSHLAKEMAYSALSPCPLAVAIVNANNYKSLINLCGDSYANEALKAAAEELKYHIRGCDTLASHGADELILYMPKKTAKEAQAVLNGFNDALSHITFTDKKIKISFSCGITQLKGENDDIDSLIHRAQLALYHARKVSDNPSYIEY